MQTYISLLRGINVSGKNPLKMTELQLMFEGLKFKNVKTYIQSGNVVFRCKETPQKELEEKISEQIFEEFTYKLPVIVLNMEEWKIVFENNPFIHQGDRDLSKLHVTFLSDIPEKSLVDKVLIGNYVPDEFIVSGKVIYISCPNSYGNTKLSNTFFENKLKVKATTRNWKSVTILMEMAQSNSSDK